MTYVFQPKRMYGMPTHFGLSLGPRQGPDGRKFAAPLCGPERSSLC